MQRIRKNQEGSLEGGLSEDSFEGLALGGNESLGVRRRSPALQRFIARTMAFNHQHINILYIGTNG